MSEANGASTEMSEANGASTRLTARGLSVVYGDRHVLRGVDLDLEAGEVLGVLGPSGAGKSTLFGALTGDGATTAGVVRLDGADITGMPLWKRARLGVGYIPQSPSVLWDLSVRENLVTFHRVVHGVSPASVKEAAERVELGERLDVKAGALSAGERRRLEFARAITRRPRVLVCDEPFAGVDPGGGGAPRRPARGAGADGGGGRARGSPRGRGAARLHTGDAAPRRLGADGGDPGGVSRGSAGAGTVFDAECLRHTEVSCWVARRGFRGRAT